MDVIVDHTQDTKHCSRCGEIKNRLMGFSQKGTYCRDCTKETHRAAKLRGYGKPSGNPWKRFVMAQKSTQETET